MKLKNWRYDFETAGNTTYQFKDGKLKWKISWR